MRVPLGSQMHRHRPPRHLQWGGQDPAPARAHAGAWSSVGGVGTRAPGASRGVGVPGRGPETLLVGVARAMAKGLCVNSRSNGPARPL